MNRHSPLSIPVLTLRRHRARSLIILILTGIIIGVFSYNTVWLGDDIIYSQNLAYQEAFSSSTEDLAPSVETLHDIIESQNIHYFRANGRYVAHFLVQGFCGIWGHLPFAIANGIVYILFFLTILKLCGIPYSNCMGVATAVLIGLITFQTKMMPSCQIGYIWMFTLTLGLLILFFRYNRKTSPWWLCALMFPLSIIVGNGQESLNFGVGVAFFLYWLSNRKRISAMQYLIMIGFWIGLIIDCLSPATLQRGGSTIEGSSILRTVFKGVALLYQLRAVWFLIAVYIYCRIRHKTGFRHIYSNNAFYFNCLFTLLLFNFILHFPSNRAAFGIELMAMIIGIRILPKQSLNRFWISILVIWLGISYTFQFQGIWRKKNFVAELRDSYSKSSDGIVYLDMDFSSPLSENRNFSGKIIPLGVNHEGDYSYYEYNCLSRKLSSDYKGKPKVRILPEFLAGKDHVDLGNQLIYCGNKIWLAVQSKSSPAKFEVRQSIPVFPAIGATEIAEVNMEDPNSKLMERDNWRARFIAASDFATHNFKLDRRAIMIEK